LKDVVAKVGKPESTVKKHIKKFCDAGYLVKRGVRAGTKYKVRLLTLDDLF